MSKHPVTRAALKQTDRTAGHGTIRANGCPRLSHRYLCATGRRLDLFENRMVGNLLMQEPDPVEQSPSSAAAGPLLIHCIGCEGLNFLRLSPVFT